MDGDAFKRKLAHSTVVTITNFTAVKFLLKYTFKCVAMSS